MAKKLRFTLPILAAFLFIGLFTVSVSPLHAQSLGMIVPLENLINKDGLEGAKARVFVYTNGPRSRINFEIDAKNLHCRSGGTLPDCDACDKLGAAFYSLYLTTATEPATRLHIFNTNCSTKTYRGSYQLEKYLKITGQTEDDILMSPITLEIMFERDQNGNGFYESDAVVFSNETD